MPADAVPDGTSSAPADSSAAPADTSTAAGLEALSTEQLRQQAFDRAQHHHDLAFFWDLVKHLRSSEELASDDGSAGGLGESITGLVELVTELVGRRTGELEPLLRARYIDYLTT